MLDLATGVSPNLPVAMTMLEDAAPSPQGFWHVLHQRSPQPPPRFGEVGAASILVAEGSRWFPMCVRLALEVPPNFLIGYHGHYDNHVDEDYDDAGEGGWEWRGTVDRGR